jgi:hypothetical protein
MNRSDIFCADLSLEVGMPMIGTAPVVDAWFLLEYDGPWTAKATSDNNLPQPVQDWLAGAVEMAGRGRLQFIKQKQTASRPGFAFFVALAREINPLLYEFHFESYDHLLSLDLSGLLAGESGVRQNPRTEPLYLVCTNGKRDRCCSRLGLTLYKALDERLGADAWQCTHLGGHRFAPTMVTFPGGTCYGRLTPADLAPLVTTQSQDELLLTHLRGRSCYEQVVQAADWFLRQETGLPGRDAYRLLDARPIDETQWAIRFAAPATGEIYRLLLSQTMSDAAYMVSCSPAKSKPLPQFNLISMKKEDHAPV